MSNKQTLEAAISKAIEGGWKPIGLKSEFRTIQFEVLTGECFIGFGARKISFDISLAGVLFNHDFAKSFFGEGDAKELAGGLPHVTRDYRPEWKERLMDMVVEPDPIKFLEQFV